MYSFIAKIPICVIFIDSIFLKFLFLLFYVYYYINMNIEY